LQKINRTLSLSKKPQPSLRRCNLRLELKGPVHYDTVLRALERG